MIKPIHQDYELKKEKLQNQLLNLHAQGQTIRLNKDTSNLFRNLRKPGSGMDVRAFNRVLSVDPKTLTAEVEGMTTYEALVDACLKQHCLPCVVPQLKTITVGGALTGLGIESTSFKYGLVHETVLEFEVLLSDGRVVLCSPDNEYQDLFTGFPNSYGTLGYALRIKLDLYPIKPFVKLVYQHFTDSQSYFGALKALCLEKRQEQTPFYMDGVAFGKNDYYLCLGELVDSAPYCSDYTYKNIYYHSIKKRKEDYLTIHDYIWRWDSDWFWCSKVFYAENPLVRTLLSKKRLNSAFYGRVRRFFAQQPLAEAIFNLITPKSEAIIQDVQIPIDKASEFLEFFENNIGITPIWLCPTMPCNPTQRYDLYEMNANTLYINFGFWDKKLFHGEEGYYNRLIEKKVEQLGGKKSLYSNSYYTEEEFRAMYNQSQYQNLKTKYDPEERLLGLFEKCCVKPRKYE